MPSPCLCRTGNISEQEVWEGLSTGGRGGGDQDLPKEPGKRHQREGHLEKDRVSGRQGDRVPGRADRAGGGGTLLRQTGLWGQKGNPGRGLLTHRV